MGMAGNQGGDAWFKTAMPLRAWELHWAMPGTRGGRAWLGIEVDNAWGQDRHAPTGVGIALGDAWVGGMGDGG